MEFGLYSHKHTPISGFGDDALYKSMFYITVLIQQPVAYRGFHFGCINLTQITSGYAMWFTAGDAIRIPHYDVIDDVITRKL